MKTVIFLTKKEAQEYINENQLKSLGEIIEFDESSSNLEYYNLDFFKVVGSWCGELSAEVYTDGESETAISWWYANGEGPTITVEGEEIECYDLIGGVCTDGEKTNEIGNEAAQSIAIACKLNRIDVYTAEDDDDDFDAMAVRLNLNNAPHRIIQAGDYTFCIPSDM